MSTLDVLIASGNRSKIDEFFLIASVQRPELATQLRFLDPRSFSSSQTPPEIVEDADTYHDNALKKALGFYEVYETPVLADDSGLEVEALSGEPGILSARFGGGGLSSSQKNDLLLQKLALHPTPWIARFRCVLCYYSGMENPLFFEAVAEGHIVPRAEGTHGFGYDPIFFSPVLGKTFALASSEEKATVSHRGLAMVQWLDFISSRVSLA